jgi:hypothetical protein
MGPLVRMRFVLVEGGVGAILASTVRVVARVE